MADRKLRINRSISLDECPWLENPIDAGTIVYRYGGVTYGCIGAGLAVTLQEGKTPFFEIPRDSVEVGA